MTDKKENRVQLIFAGIVLDTENRRLYSYINTELDREERYKTKLWKYETVGAVIEATKTDTGVQGPYKHLGKVSDELWPKYCEDVTLWSIQERANLESLRVIAESKKDHPNSLNALVQEIKEHSRFLNSNQRKSLALWIYTQVR